MSGENYNGASTRTRIARPHFSSPVVVALCFLSVGCSGIFNRASNTDTKKQQQITAPEQTPNKSERAQPLSQSIGIRCSFIPAGEFWMGGNPGSYTQQVYGEHPRHRVSISSAFWMSQTEITVGQFRKFVEETNYRTEAEQSGLGCNCLNTSTGEIGRQADRIWTSPGFPQTEQHPVVAVSWGDARNFCQWLSNKEGRACRLPSEAEWEYACRAGTDSVFHAGNEISSIRRVANVGDLSLKKEFQKANHVAGWNDQSPFTQPVGQLEPNQFGLYDMHGNVGEWCQDWFSREYYSRSPSIDPQGPIEPTQWRVVRGGSWFNSPINCRASGRHDGISTAASTTNGFRIVVE
jgi:formylglycine-generating enzyme